MEGVTILKKELSRRMKKERILVNSFMSAQFHKVKELFFKASSSYQSFSWHHYTNQWNPIVIIVKN